MATCKECFYFTVCGGFMPTDYDQDVWDLCAKGKADEIPDIEKRCFSFKDQSRFVEFPCKVGDTVWFVGTSNINRLKLGVIETTVEKLVLKAGGTYMKLACNAVYETSCRSIGKTVFFTREAAEQALAERSKQ